MRKYIPTFNRVLIRMKPQQGISAGGLYLPNQSASNEGVVEAMGPCACKVEDGYVAEGTGFKVGDTVLVDRSEVRGLSANEPDLVLVIDEHIIAVVREAEPEGN